jgi:hypothetical protein
MVLKHAPHERQKSCPPALGERSVADADALLGHARLRVGFREPLAARWLRWLWPLMSLTLF